MHPFIGKVCVFMGLIFNVGHTLGQDGVYEFDDAEKKPTWELGLFGAGINVPNYPGSDEVKSRGILLPYGVYRGPVFQILDGSFINAKTIDNQWVSLDMSASAALNVDEDEDTNRDGMTELDYMFGIGPRLTFHLLALNDKNKRQKIDFGIEARAIFSTDFERLDDRGYVIQPGLSYKLFNLFDLPLNFSGGLNVTWANERYLDYLYEVPEAAATLNRPAYDAESGFMHAGLSLGLGAVIMKKGQVFIATSFRSLTGSVIEDSPLVKRRTDTSVFLGVRWVLWESET